MEKRGQMEISFGMIFTIILIIAFVVFAFYAIQKFLGMQKKLEIGSFVSSFQEDVDRIWKSSKASQEASYSLPNKIKKVCFIDYYSALHGKDKKTGDDLKQVFNEKENLFFYPLGSAEGLDAFAIEHIDIEKITKDNNPNCFDSSGKIQLTIKKDYDYPLVVIE
jgi:hypothetical protein